MANTTKTSSEIFKMTEREPNKSRLDKLIERLGSNVENADDWMALAYLCLDQAGCTIYESGAAIRIALGERRP